MTLTEFLLARIAEDEAFWRAMPFGPTFGHAEMWERMKLDCVAKRRVVSECASIYGEDRWHDAAPALAWNTLRNLAAIYSDYPDYREEWRP